MEIGPRLHEKMRFGDFWESNLDGKLQFFFLETGEEPSNRGVGRPKTTGQKPFRDFEVRNHLLQEAP
jgi:hypothetical protein